MSIINAAGYGWRHAGRAKPALHGIDVTIEAGERVLILGPSGAGKSTLLAALAGVLHEDDGEAHGQLRTAPGTRVGLVLQDPDAQAVHATVGEDVAFGPENLGLPPEEIQRRTAQALATVGLGQDADRPVQHLSGGQRQRLALAGVLAMGPQVIALDEPTANIDPASVPDLVAAVDNAARSVNAALIVVEHRVAEWLPIVDRIIVVNAGTITHDGPAVEVLREASRELRDAGVWAPGAPPRLPDRHPVAWDAPWALRAEDLAMGWDHPLHEHLSTHLPEGAITCLTGHNGAGKSTLLLTLGGLLPPQAGGVVASDAVRAGLGPDPHQWRPRQVARRIGTVFQNPEHQFVTRTVREELTLGGTPQDRVSELLERLRLAHLAKAHPFTLSGGEKRRLSVATALASRPRVVLLDEPTFGQDRTTFTELAWLLRELAEEGTALGVVTHDPLLVGALGDKEVRL